MIKARSGNIPKRWFYQKSYQRFKFWESSAVALYGFNGIPYNVLIDPSGKIIADNLRGGDLERKLAEVLQ